MSVNNPAKLIGLCVLVVCSTLALATGKLHETAWVAIIGPIGGYLVGNGIAAKRDDPVEPVIGPSRLRSLPPPPQAE